MKTFWNYVWAGFRSMLALTVILGALYPVAMWGVGQAVAHDKANGSLVIVDGHPVGSRLIAQQFTDPEWLWPRPSAADYDANASAASNLGPNSDELLAQIDERKRQLAEANHVNPDDIPADALTASASGLDPDISPANAEQQVERIAAARGLPAQTVRDVVARHTKGRILGILGEPRVNVLEVNLDLAGLR